MPAAIGATALALIHLPRVQRTLFAILAARAQPTMGASVEAADFRFDLLRGKLEIGKLAVRSASAEDLPPLAFLESATLHFSPLRLFQGFSAVRDIRIRNLALHWVVTPDGRTNLPPAKPSAPFDWSRLSSSITVEEGSVLYEDRSRDVRIELPRLRLTSSENAGRRDLALALLAPGHVALDRRRLAVDELNLAGKLVSADLEVQSMTVGFPGVSAHLQGRIRNRQEPSLDLTLHSELQLGDLGRALGEADPPDGAVRLDALVTGPVGKLTAEGSLEAKDFRLSGMDPWSGKASLHFDQACSELALRELSARSPMGTVAASGSIRLAERAGRSSLQVTARELDTGRLMSRFGLRPAIAGRASGTARVTWEGADWQAARLALDMKIAPQDPGEKTRFLALGGALRLELDARNLALQFTGMRGSGFQFGGNLRFDRVSEEWHGQFAGTMDEGASAFQVLRRAWPAAIADTTPPLDGRASWSAQVLGSPADPRVSVRIDSASLRIGRLKDIGLTGRVDYATGRCRLEDIRLSWQGQNGQLSGEIDTRSAGSPSLSLDAGFDHAALPSLLAGLGLEVPLAGRLSGNLAARGTFSRPVIEGTLQSSELGILGENLGLLSAGFRIGGGEPARGTLRLERPGSSGESPLEASGSLDWDRDLLDFRVSAADWRIDSMTLPDGTGIRGIFSLAAEGRTSLSAPSWAGRFSGREISAAERNLGALAGTWSAVGNRIQFLFDFPDLSTTLSGEAGLASPFPVTAAAESAGTDLRRLGLPSRQGFPMEGSVAGRIQVDGPLARPRELTASALLQDLLLRFAGHEIRTSKPILAEWNGETLHLAPASLSFGDATLQLGGSISWSAGGTGEGLFMDGTLPVTLLPRLVPGIEELEVQGSLQVHAALRGSLSDPALSAEISGRDGTLRIPGLKTPLTRIATDLRIDTREIVVRQLEANLADGRIRAQASFPLSALLPGNASGVMKGELELENIDPGVLADIPGGLAGNLRLRAEGEAPRPELRLLRATIRFPELRLKTEKSEVAQVGESLLRIADGQLSVERFLLKGPQTELQVTGSLGLLEEGTLDLKITGTSDAQQLMPAGGTWGAAGTVAVGLAVGGTFRDPQLHGSIEVKGGRFRLPIPPLSAEDFQGRLEFNGTRGTLTGFRGRLNGGRLTAEGAFGFDRQGLRDLAARIRGTNLFLDYPKGLRTASNLDLEARSEGRTLLVSGSVLLQEGEHREAIHLQSLPATTVPGAAPNPLLEPIRLNLQIRTVSPLSIDNNLARVDAYADLRLTGTTDRPSLLGRVELEEGGRVYIGDRIFTVSRATVSFTKENAIEPTLDLQAQTRIAEYTVTVHAQGGLKDLKAVFSSDPPATEEQIYALLLTGSVNNADRISSGRQMSRSALALFGSTMAGGFNMRVRRALGLSDFRIEPSLISPDSDPTARLTIGQNLTPNLRLTYSINLQNSNDKIVIGEYDWRRTIQGRYVSQTEDTDRGEVRHRLRFGGGSATGDIRGTRRASSLRISSLDLEGELSLPRQEILKQLRLKQGQKYDSIEVQEKMEALTRYFARKGYLEMNLRQESERGERSVRLKLILHSGRPVSFDFRGIDLPKGIRKQIAGIWQESVVDAQRLAEASALIRRYLTRERFCDATVEPRVEAQAEEVGARKVVFEIAAGPRYRQVELVFQGPKAALARDLRKAVQKAGLHEEISVNPDAVRQETIRYLQGLGYLSAEAAPPHAVRNREEGIYRWIIPVDTGPRYRLGSLQFEGNAGIAAAALRKVLGARVGDRYVAAQRDDFSRALQDYYWRKGYREAQVEAVAKLRPGDAMVDLRFRIREDRLSVVADIQVEGTVKTSEEFLRRRVSLKKGQAADGDRIDSIRRKLFQSGTYSMADITLQPPDDGKSAETTAATPSSPAPTQPLDLKLQVREPKPFSLDYGVTYDSSRGAGGIVDFSNRNLLGEGRYLGYRIIADREELNQRTYFTQPFLGRSDLSTTLDGTHQVRRIDHLKIVEKSLTLQQQVEFSRKFTFSYGYRFQSAEVTLRSSDPRSTLDPQTTALKATTSPVLSVLSRDTRDEIFDPTRGSYTSHAVEIASRALGGNLGYGRYFGQYFKYMGLSRPGRVPFQEVRRPRFIFAAGIRAGFLRPLGGTVVTPAERFFGGGGSTVRGFTQNDLGPKLPDGQPVGGQALLFLNGELRAPLYQWIDTALFSDFGNVWAKASDFRLADVRKTAGFGIRIRNPFILIRLDYGWKLDRLPGESRGAFHFSIGQAF